MKIIKTILFLLILTYYPYSQHITNTLGSMGIFTIKDAGTTYLSIKQSDGLLSVNNNINLSLTTSQDIGIILKGNQRFLHDFTGSGSSGGNTFLGIFSGNFTMTSAGYNSALGEFTLSSLTTGTRNTAVGFRSMIKTTSGTDNSALGSASMYFNTTGSFNSAFGVGSLYSNTTSNGNSAFGYNTLNLNTGFNNSAFGAFALYLNTTGSNNSTFGFNSLEHNSTGSYNSSFGTASMYENTTGSFNSSFGYWSLKENTTGNYNCGFGSQTLTNSTIGINNCAFGFGSMNLNVSGSSNTALGHNSMIENVSGTGNTSIGAFSFTGNTTGQLNTVIGYQAGSNIVSGSNNTLIGYNAEPSSSTVSNQITLGNNSVTSLRCNVTTITSLSDRRDKKNIHDLNLGLSFISKLRPRIYNWDKREWYDNNISDGSKMRGEPTAGFIAQELDSLQTSENAEWLNLVLKDNPDKLEATPGNLLPVMVKAIQELNTKCEALKQENEKLSTVLNEVNELKKKLALLTSQIEQFNFITGEREETSGRNKKSKSNIQIISNENSK